MHLKFIVFSACGVADAASSCDADSQSLLQSRSSVRQMAVVGNNYTMLTDADQLLETMQHVASSLAKDSDSTMTPDEVNEAIGTANQALNTMLPTFAQQHSLAQQELQHALAAIQGCHNDHGGAHRTQLDQAVTNRLAAKEQCHESLNTAIDAEKDACEGQGDDPNCLCNEARTAIVDQIALCDAVDDTYDAVFCERQESCGVHLECYTSEFDVYNSLRSDVEAGMLVRQQQYQAYMQSQCILQLITAAMVSGTPINHQDLISCSEVDIAELTITFPDVPAGPEPCPTPVGGDPDCDAAEPAPPPAPATTLAPAPAPAPAPALGPCDTTPAPGPAPAPAPPPAPGCADKPSGWKGTEGSTCADYGAKQWCTADGGYGSGWKDEWGKFEDMATNGKSALQVCCVCGGGVQVAEIGRASCRERV